MNRFFLLPMKALFFVLLPFILSAADYATCDIFGQLGNQMFQIAATAAYAKDHGAKALFPQLRQAINGDLNIQYVFHRVDISPLPEGVEFVLHNHNQITDTFVYKPIPDYGQQNVLLHAHFCSEKYFKKHEQAIRDLFAPTPEIVEAIQEKYGDLLAEPNVAIHVRTYRPDHFLCPLQVPNHLIAYRWHYYINAMNHFPHNTRFILFSDDPDWTEQHFPRTGKKVTFIRGNPHYFDFYFMSLCDHHIVSYDSTYSWWAAWLNENPRKTVIIPDTAGNVFGSDMLPDDWIKIPRFPKRVN